MQSGHPVVAAMETRGLCFHNSRDAETQKGVGVKRRDRSLLTSAQKRKTPRNIGLMTQTDALRRRWEDIVVREALHRSRVAQVTVTESAFYGVHLTLKAGTSLTTWCHLSTFNPWRKCHQSGLLAWPDVSRSIWWHTIDILAWYCILK